MPAEEREPFDEQIDFAALFAALPTAYLVLSPDLRIVDANHAYLTSLARTRSSLVGQKLFDAFPPDANLVGADGLTDVQRSMEHVLRTGQVEVMPLQAYPIRGIDGEVVERYWLIVHSPVVDDQGEVVLLVQRSEDLGEFVRDRRRAAALEQGAESVHDRRRQSAALGADVATSTEKALRHIELIEADLFIRAGELAAAVAAKDAAAAQVAAMADVALALTSAETVEDLERIVVGRGLTVLGADGGAVISPAEDGGWRMTVSAALGQHVQTVYGNVSYDSVLPACWTARTGERLLLPTQASGLQFNEGMAVVYEDTHRAGWAFLPLKMGNQSLGCLAVSWVQEYLPSADELSLLDGFAAQCAQSLQRIRAADAQRDNAKQIKQLAEALQQALLTPPPEPDHLHVVVRYRPAADIAQVGGDWYDAFMQPDGATMLVIGDVMGHDGTAAAKMGQIRGLLRALAYSAVSDDSQDAPAAILTRVEHAARGLDVETLATVILARIEQVPGQSGTGTRTLRWSNAGHLPPVLLHPDGRTELLRSERADLLLGVNPHATRTDHAYELEDNCTLLLYTDGLIERRNRDIDESLEMLRAALADLASVGLDELCDTLLDRLAIAQGGDDIALVAVRTYPESLPRPAVAGPEQVPPA